MKPNPIVSPARRVLKRAKKTVFEQLEDALDAYYQARIDSGLSTNEARIMTVSVVDSHFQNRLP